jgi:hypothetical protein
VGALTVRAATTIVSVCALAGYIVRITGTTTGIADIGRAIGAMLAAIITGPHRPPPVDRTLWS